MRACQGEKSTRLKNPKDRGAQDWAESRCDAGRALGSRSSEHSEDLHLFVCQLEEHKQSRSQFAVFVVIDQRLRVAVR